VIAKLDPISGLYQFAAKPASNHAFAAMAHSGEISRVLLAHKRMGHTNFRLLQEIFKRGEIPDIHLTDTDFKGELFCSACAYAKSHKAPFNRHPVERSTYSLQRVHSDICGPFPVKHSLDAGTF
jgi:hypothetical protein